jgi:CRP-like cAMP-binding protein
MDDLDFSIPPPPHDKKPAAAPALQPAAAQSPLYDPKVALEFFRSTGTVELKPAGKPIFVENEKSSGLFSKSPKMYLLLEGEIVLMVGKRFFGVVTPGDLFGELAVIAKIPRSATAMAKIDCRVMALDERQFHAALRKSPEFALMLMSIMVSRMRESLAKLGTSATAGEPVEREAVLDQKMLGKLEKELSATPPMVVPGGKVIMSAGTTGAFMFVVLKGRVTISAQERVVERLGPGAMFGEMAVFDRSARAATASAETDCTLLAIVRNDFLALMKANPAFGASLLRSIAERMQFIAAQLARIQA